MSCNETPTLADDEAVDTILASEAALTAVFEEEEPCKDCLSCEELTTQGPHVSGLSGTAAAETFGWSDEDFGEWLFAEDALAYAAYALVKGTYQDGYQEQTSLFWQMVKRTRFVWLNVNGGHMALRGTRTAADVAYNPTDAQFGPQFTKPIASNGFLVNIPDLWSRLRFQFSPKFLFGRADTSVDPEGIVLPLWLLICAWNPSNGSMASIVQSDDHDVAAGFKSLYLHRVQAGKTDEYVTLCPLANIIGSPKELVMRTKRGLTPNTNQTLFEIFLGDAFQNNLQLLYRNTWTGSAPWGTTMIQFMAKSTNHEDLAPGETSKCYDIIEAETIRGLDYNDPFGAY